MLIHAHAQPHKTQPICGTNFTRQNQCLHWFSLLWTAEKHWCENHHYSSQQLCLRWTRSAAIGTVKRESLTRLWLKETSCPSLLAASKSTAVFQMSQRQETVPSCEEQNGNLQWMDRELHWGYSCPAPTLSHWCGHKAAVEEESVSLVLLQGRRGEGVSFQAVVRSGKL